MKTRGKYPTPANSEEYGCNEACTDDEVKAGGKSEVAQLREQILAEYEAGKRGLEGLAQGTAQHQFLTKKAENMWRCQKQLIALVGEAQASQLLAEVGL